VFVGGRDGVVYALSADTGRVEWRANLGIRIRTSVILAAGGLYVGTNDGSVFRLDPADGAIRASHRLHTTLGPRVLAAMDGSLLVLLADATEAYLALVSIDPELSGVRWRQVANTPWSTSRVFVTNQMAILGSRDGEVAGYCVADGSKAWSHGVKGTVRAFSGSVDALYVGTMEGSLYALAPAPSCRVE
jgi:outer membrane protein assembly factor BamB